MTTLLPATSIGLFPMSPAFSRETPTARDGVSIVVSSSPGILVTSKAVARVLTVLRAFRVIFSDACFVSSGSEEDCKAKQNEPYFVINRFVSFNFSSLSTFMIIDMSFLLPERCPTEENMRIGKE